MNHVILSGRLAADPETNKNVTKYRLAVDRKGEGVDWINVTCFGKTAEFADKYLKKGTKILVEGRIQTGSYTRQDGSKVNTFEVIASGHEFCEGKKAQGGVPNNGQVKTPTDAIISANSDLYGGFEDIGEEELPFK